MYIYCIVSITRVFVPSMFLCVVSVVLHQVLLKVLSPKLEADGHSFAYYGTFWGLSAILCMVLVPLVYIECDT